MQQSQILIVDDEAAVCTLLMRQFRANGLASESCTNPEEALELLKSHPFELVVTDLKMPGINGLELLRRARRIRPNCEVVMMTAHATVATAREALTQGAADYLTKPFSVVNDLLPLVNQLLAESASDASEVVELPSIEQLSLIAVDDAMHGVVAQSRSMKELVERTRRVAASEAAVLLQGESGTGKEIIANLIHNLSPRREQNFVKVNCAALPEGLLESELFGYAKGAFAGAARDRAGLFEVADGGTLLLDEVGEISPRFQPKLLRVLQDGEFYRVGDSSRTVKADVRIVAATNRDLENAVSAGTFRQDLFYRLNAVPLELPPLRERIEDLYPLVDHFAVLFDKGRNVEFNSAAMELLEDYPWPGNIRELANAVEFALVLTEGAEIGVGDLPVAIQDFGRTVVGSAASECAGQSTLEEIEKNSILHVMVKQNFNRTRAAQLLGVTRRTLGYRIKKYGLEGELKRWRLEGLSAEGGGMARVRRPEALPSAFSAESRSSWRS